MGRLRTINYATPEAEGFQNQARVLIGTIEPFSSGKNLELIPMSHRQQVQSLRVNLKSQIDRIELLPKTNQAYTFINTSDSPTPKNLLWTAGRASAGVRSKFQGKNRSEIRNAAQFVANAKAAYEGNPIDHVLVVDGDFSVRRAFENRLAEENVSMPQGFFVEAASIDLFWIHFRRMTREKKKVLIVLDPMSAHGLIQQINNEFPNQPLVIWSHSYMSDGLVPRTDNQPSIQLKMEKTGVMGNLINEVIKPLLVSRSESREAEKRRTPFL